MKNFSITCRCCLKVSTKSSLVSLFEKQAKYCSLSETLQNCTNLVVYENDGLPTAVCTKCAKILQKFEKLKETSIKSETFLRKQLSKKTSARTKAPEMSDAQIKIEKSEYPGNVENLLIIPVCELKEEASTFSDPAHSSIKYEEDASISSNQEEPVVAEKVKKAAPRNSRRGSFLPTEDDFACCMCVKFCKNQDELTKHLQTHTLPPLLDHLANNPVECKMCFRRFKDEKNLKLHLVRKYRPKSTKINQCKHCGKIFAQPASMKYCEQKHEGRLEKYECDLCKATFGMRSNLKTHMQLHTGKRKYACDVCGDAFKQLAVLQRHMLTHTGVRNYSCELCGKAFSTTSSLVVHKRVHTGERPYTCPFQGCGKTFIHASDRYRHKMTHTGERPHDCTHPGCTKKFRTRTLLKMHFRMHIGIKEFKCTLCPVEYFQPRSLKRHMSEKHSALNLGNQGNDEELCD